MENGEFSSDQQTDRCHCRIAQLLNLTQGKKHKSEGGKQVHPLWPLPAVRLN